MRFDCCKHLLRQEANEAFFFRRIVTMDETWIYQFDPEPKSVSMQWKRPSLPPPKKAKVTQSSGKVMLSCFLDCDGIIMTDYMEKGKTITGEYYSGLLERLRSELARRRRGKLRSGVLLFAWQRSCSSSSTSSVDSWTVRLWNSTPPSVLAGFCSIRLLSLSKP